MEELDFFSAIGEFFALSKEILLVVRLTDIDQIVIHFFPFHLSYSESYCVGHLVSGLQV